MVGNKYDTRSNHPSTEVLGCVYCNAPVRRLLTIASLDLQLPLIFGSLLLSAPLIVDINSRPSIDATGISLASNTITNTNARSSVRQRLLAVKSASPDHLQFAEDTLVTKILLCQDANLTRPRAYGVEIARGQGLPVQLNFGGKQNLTTEQVLVKREVIVAAGTFQTPQLVSAPVVLCSSIVASRVIILSSWSVFNFMNMLLHH